MNADARSSAAAALAAAQHKRQPVPPLTATYGPFDVVDAYAIQQLNVDARRAAGGRLVGHKVGLTAKAMQEMLGVFEPDFGALLDDMMFGDGSTVPTATLCQPRIELEIAFVLAAPLAGPGVTAAQVVAATEAVLPALEIIDSRIEDWRITLSDTVADNASSAAVVLGPSRHSPDGLDLTDIDAELLSNGEVMATGSSSAVLGDPALAVAWLANKLGELGTSLVAGEVVMPGSCTKAIDVASGDRITGRLGPLGEVSVAFG